MRLATRRKHVYLRILIALCFLGLVVITSVAQRSRTEAFEIGRHNTDQLPSGKEADGIIGDFVLRNDKIVALVSGNQPGRRANMTTEYQFPTPGCLYDLDLRGANNDQLTAFRPGNQGGELSWVRVIEDGSKGVAAVEAVRTAAKGDGLYVRHEYRLEPGWQYLLVISTYRNESSEEKVIKPEPVWKEFSKRWVIDGIRVGDAIDPFDKRAYAWVQLRREGDLPIDREVTLKPGEEKRYTVAVAVGRSPLEAYGIAKGLLSRTTEVSGKATDVDGKPAVHASVLVRIGQEELPAYPDENGEFAFRLPPGTYQARVEDIGRPEVKRTLSVPATGTARLDLTGLPRASAVRFDIRDEEGQPSPCKVQFIGRNGTPTPYLGTDYRAHGTDHQYHSHDGQFVQQVPPGDYLIRITRGPEYDLVERNIRVAPDEVVEIKAQLHRSVDTTGWVSTDFHSHSTPSGDNYCNTYDRIINLVAEHIEFAPTTEHNRFFDWQPYIDRLGLSRKIRTVVGIELTGRGQHFNSFPLKVIPFTQDNGAPNWQYDPRLNAIVLRDLFGGGPDRWVQANHPIVGYVFGDRNRDGIYDGGFVGFENLIDAAEFWSTEILNLKPYYEQKTGNEVRRIENRTFGWLQLLNQGRRIWCVAVSDAHRVFGNGVGGWRTYVPSSTDIPGDINPTEIILNAKAGRMMITNGPFLEVTTKDGQPIGSTLIAPGVVTLKIRVQTPNWFNIDRVQILVNGRQPEEYNFTRAKNPEMFRNGTVQFDNEVTVHLQHDAHLIVVAVGENETLEKGWGRAPQASMRPMAYTNPIFVDIDGKGFEANGDTLGYPLLTAPQSD